MDHAIDLESLRKLKDLFGSDGELDQNEFVEAYGAILGDNLSDIQLTHLFMKIDANSDGSVDWEEFTNYMFLGNEDTSDGQQDDASVQYLPPNFDVYRLNNADKHYQKDQIVSLAFMEKSNQLVSASQNGVIRLWHPTTLMFQGSFRTNGLEKNWLTDMAFLQHSNRLAVSSLDDGVTIYDMVTEGKKVAAQLEPRVFGHSVPLCLASHCDDSKELLMIGDDSGAAHIYKMNERSWTGKRTCFFKKHSDHITKIGYVSDLSSMLSSSLDSTVNVYDLERDQLKRKFTQHQKEVYSFIWCPGSKVIASCGLERDIILWSPYSKSSVGLLTGHTASVLKVQVNKINHQLISLGSDNTVKIWDIRNHKCIQTICMESDSDRQITCLEYLPKQKCLIGASNKLKICPIKVSCGTIEKSHDRSIIAALYNSSFHQIVSADEKANLRIWNVDNGQRISNFRLRATGLNSDFVDTSSRTEENTDVAAAANFILQEDGTSQPLDAVAAVHHMMSCLNNGESESELVEDASSEMSVTAICFDDGGRRLITGSHYGDDLKVWNFNNGCLLQTLTKVPARVPDHKNLKFKAKQRKKLFENFHQQHDKPKKSAEVTKIIYVVHPLPLIPGQPFVKNRYIISVGWDRRIYVWADASSAKFQGYTLCIPHHESDMEHTDDIMTISYAPPDTLITGGYDGLLLFWSLSSGRMIRMINDNVGIETTLYLENREMLLASRSDGTCLMVDKDHTGGFILGEMEGEPLLCMVSDDANDILIAGDVRGWIQIWDILEYQSFNNRLLHRCAKWKAHDERVTSVEYVKDNQLPETFLVSGCSDGAIFVWTMTGVPIGMFGQHSPFQLEEFSVFEKDLYHTDFKHQSIDEYTSEIMQAVEIPERCKQKLLSVENLKTYRRLPNVGEVWIKLDIDKAKLIDIYLPPSDNHPMLINPRVVLEMITITRHDAVREEMKGFGRVVCNKESKVVSVSDFLTLKENYVWYKDEFLSDMIGRIYEDGQIPFKILFSGCDLKQWNVFDTQLSPRPLPDLTALSFLKLKPPKSISLFHRRREMVEVASRSGSGETVAAPVSPHRPSSRGLVGKEPSIRQRATKRPVHISKQQVQGIVDIPKDFKQLRATLSISATIKKM